MVAIVFWTCSWLVVQPNGAAECRIQTCTLQIVNVAEVSVVYEQELPEKACDAKKAPPL